LSLFRGWWDRCEGRISTISTIIVLLYYFDCIQWNLILCVHLYISKCVCVCTRGPISADSEKRSQYCIVNNMVWVRAVSQSCIADPQFGPSTVLDTHCAYVFLTTPLSYVYWGRRRSKSYFIFLNTTGIEVRPNTIQWLNVKELYARSTLRGDYYYKILLYRVYIAHTSVDVDLEPLLENTKFRPLSK